MTELRLRTSLSDPLRIAAVQPAPTCGRIGITFCPGKKQVDGWSGRWDRDLGSDVEVIERWGAVAVVTLVEQHELDHLQASQLGVELQRRHIEWLHLPIADVSVPGRLFEQQWEAHAPGLRARLRDGFDILVHCKGGLGRAGMVAARLLVEMGMAPEDAIREVREVRPHAIETLHQAEDVRSRVPIPESRPSSSQDSIRDRARGALVGLAVGDAVGTTLEFKRRDAYPKLTDMIGGGPFHLKPGQWTDDTSMAIALGESLLECGDLDAADLMSRFIAWRNTGAYSCTGTCFDIGSTVSSALERWRRTGEAHAGSTDPATAGNGSLMRLAPVVLQSWANREKLRRLAIDQSRTTHSAPEALSACEIFAEILADAIEGRPRSEVLRTRIGAYAGRIAAIAAGSWRGKARDIVQSSGYVAHSLEAALWSVGRTADFRTAILTAANLGEDADTTAAIAGQLAGAIYGLSGIPAEWLEKLAWRERLEKLGARLVR